MIQALNSYGGYCGQRLRLSFKNWAPQYDVLKIMPDGQINYKEIEAPKECLENDVVQLDINFPSGELIITDWLRIKEFSDLVKGDDEWAPERSLNHTKGRITNTQRYAKLFNFICVSLGNMSPHIFSRGDDLIFGHLQEDKSLDKSLMEKGYVCTDFWGVSIIDKEQLIFLLAQKYPQEAQKMVDDYINENKGDITLLKVEAGSYQLNFHGNYERFNSFNKDASLSSIEQCFTLNKIGTPKMKMKR